MSRPDRYTTTVDAAAAWASGDADPPAPPDYDHDDDPPIRHACYRLPDGAMEWDHCAACWADLERDER